MTELKTKVPWLYNLDEFCENLYFHGSINPLASYIENKKALWAVESSFVASAYISDWDEFVLIDTNKFLENIDDDIAPDENCLLWQIAKELGAKAKVLQYSDNGKALSWLSTGAKITYRHIKNHLQNIGYSSDIERTCIKVDSSGVAQPKSSTRPGYLMLIEPIANMRINDIRLSSDVDLKQALLSNDDIVKINDFCTTDNLGHYNHIAYGFNHNQIQTLFDSGQIITIPAQYEAIPLTNHKSYCLSLKQWHFHQCLFGFVMYNETPGHIIYNYYEDLISYIDFSRAQFNDDYFRLCITTSGLAKHQNKPLENVSLYGVIDIETQAKILGAKSENKINNLSKHASFHAYLKVRDSKGDYITNEDLLSSWESVCSKIQSEMTY